MSDAYPHFKNDNSTSTIFYDTIIPSLNNEMFHEEHTNWPACEPETIENKDAKRWGEKSRLMSACCRSNFKLKF